EAQQEYTRYSNEWIAIDAQMFEKRKAIREAEQAAADKARADQEKAWQETFEALDANYHKERVLMTMRNAEQQEFAKLEITYQQDRLKALEESGQKWTAEYEATLNRIDELENSLLKKKKSFSEKLFDSIFGKLTAEQQEEVKAQLAGIVENSLTVMDSLL